MSRIRVVRASLAFAIVVGLLTYSIAWGLCVRGQVPTQKPGADEHGKTSAPQKTPSISTDVYRDIPLDYGVEYHIEAYVGAVVRWIAEDNPRFQKDTLVRPVSVMAIASWKDKSVSRTHMLYWMEASSDEGLAGSISVLGSQFAEPDVPPRSRLAFEVKPKTQWGQVRSDSDVLATASLEPIVEQKSGDGKASESKPK